MPDLEFLLKVDPARVPYENKVLDIQGIVSPQGQGSLLGDRYQIHSFTLDAWRFAGQQVTRRPLLVFRQIPLDEQWMGNFPTYSVHRMAILLSKDQERAVFVKTLLLDGADEELEAIGIELQKPVVVPTAQFGPLVFNREIGWFEGRAEWNGEAVTLLFETRNAEAPSRALETAEKLWSDQGQWKRKVDEFAVTELLQLKNDSWLDEEETPLTASEFVGRMVLESIQISEDGSFEFWHDDLDLFWGHSIRVCGNLVVGITEADIAG